MRSTLPLFRFDPGWLFITAGLLVCFTVVLIPAKRDLFHLQSQRDALRAEELRNNARLRTHVDFLQAADDADPELARRLVASQLNLLPEGETPVLLAANPAGAIYHWLDAAAEISPHQPLTWTETALTRLATGPRRVWLLGGGVMCVFFGLLTGGPFGVRGRETTGRGDPILPSEQSLQSDEPAHMDAADDIRK